MASGMSRQAVLNKSWTTSAKVYFQVQLVAAKKKHAKKNKWKLSNTTGERKTAYYNVVVKCLAK